METNLHTGARFTQCVIWLMGEKNLSPSMEHFSPYVPSWFELIDT